MQFIREKVCSFWKRLPWNLSDEAYLQQRLRSAFQKRWLKKWMLGAMLFSNACFAALLICFFDVTLWFGLGFWVAGALIGAASAWQMHRIAMAFVRSIFGSRIERLAIQAFKNLPNEPTEEVCRLAEQTRIDLATAQDQRTGILVLASIALVVFVGLLFLMQAFLPVLIMALDPQAGLASLGVLIGAIMGWKITSINLNFSGVINLSPAERLIEKCVRPTNQQLQPASSQTASAIPLAGSPGNT